MSEAYLRTVACVVAIGLVCIGCSEAAKPLPATETAALLRDTGKGDLKVNVGPVLVGAAYYYPNDPSIASAMTDAILAADRRGSTLPYGFIRPLAAAGHDFIARIPAALKAVNADQNFDVLLLSMVRSPWGRDYVPELRAMLSQEHTRTRSASLRFVLATMGVEREETAAWCARELQDHTEAAQRILTLGAVVGFGGWADLKVPESLDSYLTGKHGLSDSAMAALAMGASGWGNIARKAETARLLAKAEPDKTAASICYAYALQLMNGSPQDRWTTFLRVVGETEMDHTVGYALDLIRANLPASRMKQIADAASDGQSRVGLERLQQAMDGLDGRLAEKRVRAILADK